MTNSFELFFLENGFSWTLSKLTPYLLSLLLGVLLMFVFKNVLLKRVLLRRLFRVVVFTLPFIVYFIYSPIYQGDFSNSSELIEKTAAFKELDSEKLFVISIPGCPYCYESIDRLLKVKKRIPAVTIEYIVCNTSQDSLLPEDALNWYKEKGDDEIEVRQALDSKAMGKLAQNSSGYSTFPTFILLNKNGDLKKWENSNFGVTALDEIEQTFK
jgi:hypothetical protein